jgi:hypothetical protein
MIDPISGSDMDFVRLLLIILPGFLIFLLVAISLFIREAFEMFFGRVEYHD